MRLEKEAVFVAYGSSLQPVFEILVSLTERKGLREEDLNLFLIPFLSCAALPT